MSIKAVRSTLTAGALAVAVAAGGVGLAAPAQAASLAPTSVAVAPVTARSGFSDVGSSNKFATEIAWLARSGVTTGWSDGTFRPKESITREAMAAFLYRFAGSPDYTAPSHSPFRDVTRSNQFYREINWLAATGVTTGWSDGTFRPKESITREAMAAFLYRYSGKAQQFADGPSARFGDVPAGSKFADAIDWLARTGVTTGWSDGTFRPDDSITREAVAAFLYRYDRDDIPRRHFAVHAHLITPVVLDATNRYRADRHVAKLSAYECLADIALHNAEVQASRSTMFHYGNLKQAMADCDSYAAGENVAMGQRSASAAVEAWWHSPGHRENMLADVFAGMAAAVAYDSNGWPYYAQVFSGVSH